MQWVDPGSVWDDGMPEATHDGHARAALPVSVLHSVPDVYSTVRRHGHYL